MATRDSGHPLLITNTRLVDGTGAGPVDDQSILIENGRIVSIGGTDAPEGARTIDAAGATVLPGLIDAHVHLESVPGSYYRDDSDEDLWRYRVHQLKAHPACGVTTVPWGSHLGVSSQRPRRLTT
jgi:imidazolonepropionase-like amidohydrolase